MIVGTSAKRTSRPAGSAQPFVYIVSSALASLPTPGNRVGTGDATNMPTIQASAGNNAIKTAAGSHHYRLVGLQIKAPATLLQGAVVQIGQGDSVLANVPTDIIVDRCLIRGDATVGVRRGVALDGIRSAVIDCYIDQVGENGADTQAVWAYNTPGPIKIVNNRLEAAGENVMFGGANPALSNSLPRDAEIRLNYFYKPLSWQGVSTWDVKNLMEFKLGERVLVEGNVFENMWQDAQNTYALVLTPRNETGPTTWAVTQDITYRYNKIINAKSGINISGTDTNNSSQDTHRISIEHNLFTLADTGVGGDDKQFQFINGPDEVQFIHNTMVSTNAAQRAGYLANLPKGQSPVWRDNIFQLVAYGILGDGVGEGTAAFNAFCDAYSYTYNLLIGGASGSYPTGNNQFPAAATDVFVNYAGGDYTVKAPYTGDASDGTDPGANLTTLASKTQNTVSGQWGSEIPTYTDRTYTNAELPREYVDTTYRAQTGTTWNCANATDFTNALAACELGDTIVLTAGNTFTGSFTLRAI